MTTRCLPVLLLMGALAMMHAPRAARAANPITMEVGSPLALTEKPLALEVRVGRWFPVAVTLSNTGDPVRATVDLSLAANGNNDTPSSLFTTDVDLPTNSHKRIWLYGRVESDDLDLGIINVHGRGISSLKSDFSLKKEDSATRIVLTISDADEKLSYLSGLKGSFSLPDETTDSDQAIAGFNAPNSGQGLVRPVGTGHEMVPSRWIGLDAVDLLVLQDFPHTALRPEQLTALSGYVAGGGSLLVLGGANWQRLAKSPLADLWPVTPTAMSVATPAEVNELVQNHVTATKLSGADRLGGAPVVLTKASLRPTARLRQGAPDAPLLATSDYGAGQVLFLAFDVTQPPFIGWSGNTLLWGDIFGATARPHRIDSVDANAVMPGANSYRYSGYPVSGDTEDSRSPLHELLAKLDAAQQLKTPPVSYIAWFLALYVFFLVPVNYCVLRYFDKRELAWVTVPVIVLVFSVISYAAALSIKGRAVLTRHVNLVQGAGDSGAARTDTLLWLFSPRKTTYDITSPDAQTVAADYVNNEENARVTIREPDEKSAFIVENAAINMWDRRFFVAHSVISTGQGVHVQVTGGIPQVQNKTPFDLRGVVLVTAGQVRGFGDIKAGATAARPVEIDQADFIGPQLVQRIRNLSHLEQVFPTTAANIPSQMAEPALSVALGGDFGKRSYGGALLIAWSNRPASALAAKGESPQEQDITVFVFRLSGDALSVLPSPRGTLQPKHAAGIDATVQPVGSQPTDPNAGVTSGSLLSYRCELPQVTAAGAQSWRALVISGGMKVTDPNQNYSYGYPYRRYSRRGRVYSVPQPQTRAVPQRSFAARFDVWDFSHSRWQTVDTVAAPTTAGGISQSSAGSSAPFEIVIPSAATSGLRIADVVRRPDGLLRLRARTAHSGVKIESVRVRAQQG